MSSEERTYCSHCHDEIANNETICETCKKNAGVLSSPIEIISNVEENQDDKEPTPVSSPTIVKHSKSPSRKHRPPKPPKPIFAPDQPILIASKKQKVESQLRRLQHQVSFMKRQSQNYDENSIFKESPDDTYLKNLAEKLATKWKPLGEELHIPKNRLQNLSQLQLDEDAYCGILDAWKDTKNKSYTWDTFLNALRSSAVNETQLADSLFFMLTLNDELIFPTNFDNKGLFVAGDEGVWMPSEVLIKDCKRKIRFYVIIDKSIWSSGSPPLFVVSVISKEINDGKSPYGKFKCIYKKDHFEIYHCELLVPDEFLCIKEQQCVFRYRYVLIIKNVCAPETVSVYNFAEWRIVKMTSSDLEYIQYDPVIILQSTARLKFWKRPGADATCSALSVYWDWACDDKQWMTIHTAYILEEAKTKGQNLVAITSCLSEQKYVASGKLNWMYFSDVINKLILKKMAATVCLCQLPATTSDRFHTGLIFIEVLNLVFYVRWIKCFNDDIDSTLDILKALCIPTDDVNFERCVATIKNLDISYKRHSLFPMISTLCNVCIQESQHQWMGLLPLLHLIEYDSFNFIPKDLNVEDKVELVLFCGLDVLSFLATLSQEKRDTLTTNAFDLVEPYFKHDLLMLRAFVTTCSLKQLLFYVKKYPEVSPIACWLIGCKHSEEIKSNDQFITAVTTLIEKFKYELMEEETILCYKGVNSIVEKTAKRKSSHLLRVSFELFLMVINKTGWQPETYIMTLSNQLTIWMKNVYGQESHESKIEDELRKWNEMFQIKMSNEMQEIWKRIISSELLTRLSKIQLQILVKHLNSNPTIFEVLLKSIIEAARNILPNEDEKACKLLTSLQLNQVPHDQSMLILGALLSSKYANDSSISFTSLFWIPFPKCLEIYGNIFNPNICPSLTEEKTAQRVCEEAKIHLKKFFDDLYTRQITPNILDELSKVGDFIKIKQIVESFLNIRYFTHYKGIIKALESEVNAYSKFKERNKTLHHFAYIFGSINKAQTSKIEEALKLDYTMTPVSDLWECTPLIFNNCPSFVSDDVMEQVFYLTHHERLYSLVFLKVFELKLFEYNHKRKQRVVTLENAVSEFWFPLCKEFKDDLKQLRDGLKLPIKKVANFFADITEMEQLEEELQKWCVAVKETKNNNWIKNAVQKILEYQKLCCYTNTAQTVMQLKEALGLTGDFGILDALLLKESEHSTRMTLATVDTNTVENTASILKDVADYPHRRACLETFCSCIQLVEWIRSIANNVGQLQNFIQIANQTMEGDLVKQLLQDLLKFGSAFTPLIYDVRHDENLEKLIDRCKHLWNFVDKIPNLREIIESCNERLGELKRVQEILSDFQSNNIEQMDMINASGVYNVTANPGRISHCPEDAIRLRVRMTPDQASQKVYKLEDLKELQSKLVLVASAESTDIVKKFIETLSKIEQVAELLIKLQEAGHVDYTHFRLECGCSQYKKAEFDKVILEMEGALANWQESVQSHRKKYPHLNYYTSQQLLDLRQEFGKLKKNLSSTASTKLKQLLLSVTPQPKQSKIIIALTNATKQDATDGMSLCIQQRRSRLTGILAVTSQLDPSSFNEKQRRIYDTLTQIDEYKESVVLSAFSELGEYASEDTLREWCMENESKFKDEKGAVTPGSGDEIVEDNPIVLELIEEEYDIKTALKAAKLSKGDLQTAREVAADLYIGKEITEITENEEENEWNTTKYPLYIEKKVPEGEYLNLIELGEVLNELAYLGRDEGGDKYISKQRELNDLHKFVIEPGHMNMITVDPALVWKAVLYFFMVDPTQPLPTYEEVVICTEETTVEEITLLWHRAVNDEDKKRIFCLVNADKLTYNISEEVFNNLETITQGCSDFRIIILISSKDQSRSYVASRLSLYQRELPSLPSDADMTNYITANIRHNLGIKPTSTSSIQESKIIACLRSIDHIVVSTRSGMGKSLRVKRMAEIIERANDSGKPSYAYISIHGPEISVRHILEQMEQCMQDPTDPHPQLIHFNIAQSMVEKVDWLLFKILVLGGLSDNYGNIWKIVQKQICVVECTLPKLFNHENDGIASSGHKQIPNVYTLLSFFPQTRCFSPKEIFDKHQFKGLKNNVAMDELVFKEKNVQRVFEYLQKNNEKKNILNRLQIKSDPHKSAVESDADECLQCILMNMSSNEKSDPSWAEVRNFIQFLNAQLCDCEKSPYCSVDDLKGFKEFVVKFSVLMAKEFTESSVEMSQVDENLSNITEISLQQLSTRNWDTCSHPYLFFNQDGYTMTFMGLWVDKAGNLIDFRTKEIIAKNFLDKRLRKKLEKNLISFEEDYFSWKKEEMILKLMRVLGINEEKYRTDDRSIDLTRIDPDDTYVLTIDNLMKMLAIHMKFRCGIPVIMMGETGCGKTRLLRYLCQLQAKAFGVKTLICLKVHGGVTNDRVYKEVAAAIYHAMENKKTLGDSVYTVLFFDEVNTTEALGLIKEVICDRTLYGKPIPDELKFAAACNPYRIHDNDTIKSLQSAGLGFYLRDEERIPKLGSVPLRKLVYRVLPLPPSMYQFVYDFGSVAGTTEEEYIKKIVSNQLFDCQFIAPNKKDEVQITVVKVLCVCQKYMREQKNECKYVSLRDIVRAMIFFKWFLEKLNTITFLKEELNRKTLRTKRIKDSYDIMRALIYSISVCYYVRLADKTARQTFVQTIVSQFQHPYHIPGETVDEKISIFKNEIKSIQTVFLNAMDVPHNIAHNAALRENVFMMVVCIENRLPLFIVGKPGSSKSLAKSIVANSMQGQYSKNELLKNLKQIQLFPYQCNQFSTTDSLIEIFKEATVFQKSQDAKRFASVVILEEIGLAEDAPGLPLKVLHPYLEDGTAGTNPNEMEIAPEERVAFIGISNWALDPAKMNRGIMVTRCPPAQKELLKSAYGIANIVDKAPIRDELTKSFDALATMYRNICTKQEEYRDDQKDEVREFFGLRDFYTMIKMLCWKCIEKGAPPSPEDYRSAILRNFSGHPTVTPLKEIPNPASLVSLDEKENEALELIKDSLKPLKIQHGENAPKQENRYLLFMTENQSALRILQTELLKDETLYVFYGSSFPKDTEYTQVCVNINKIKAYMEKGYPVVLLNYEQIYESLYDVLNQCYTELPTGRYVDLGLRSYRIKCRVNPNFRLIIIAERNRVFTQFPIALINRLEKHFVVSETILTQKQKSLAKNLQKWIERFANIEHNGKRFFVSDAFVGYQDDTAASIILHVYQTLNASEDDEVTKQSMDILLQTASMDALARLRSSSAMCDEETKDQAFSIYFDQQNHFSLIDYLQNNLHNFADGAIIQITTFGPLLTRNYIPELSLGLNFPKKCINVFQLSDFDTELDFSSEVREMLESSSENKLMIIQCNYDERNSDLIACAQHHLIDEMRRPKKPEFGVTHMIFIIQLPRVAGGTAFTSFQGGPWTSIHIDDATCPPGVDQIVKYALSEPFHLFFNILIEKDNEVPSDFKITTRIRDNIQLAVQKIVTVQSYHGQNMEKLIDNLFELISNKVSLDCDFDSISFVNCLLMRMKLLLKERDESMIYPDKWAVNIAFDRHQLQSHLTLVNSIKKLMDVHIQCILSYILSQIDQNSNLDLLRGDNNPCIKKLWLSLFNNTMFLQFNYNDIVTSSASATNVKGRSYCCKFPFSWELIDQIEAVIGKTIQKSNLNEGNNRKTFTELVHTTTNLTFYEDIEVVPTELSLELYQHYLHDFIRNLVLPIDDSCIDSIYEIFCKVMDILVSTFEPAILSQQPFPLINAIVGVHWSYGLMEKEIFWFVELSKVFPKLPSLLKGRKLFSSGQLILHFEAAECVIDHMSPDKMNWNNESMYNWILDFHSCKNAIESVLFLKSHDETSKEILIKSRSNWQKVGAVALLAEHVISQLPPDLQMSTNKFVFLKRYNSLLKNIKFSEPKILEQSIKQIKGILSTLPIQQPAKCQDCKLNLSMKDVIYLPCDNNHMFCKACYQDSLEHNGPCCHICNTPISREMEFPIPEEKRKDYELLKQVQQHCLNFFMELVSQCCFSQIAPEKPTDAFLKKLLEIVTNTEHEDYKDLFLFEEEYAHSCPLARSVLLQLLLEYNPEQLVKKLQNYQGFIGKRFGKEYVTDDQELILLSIKSLEDGLHNQNTSKNNLDDQLQLGNKCLVEALNVLRDRDLVNEYKRTLQVEFMQCIAQVRFGMCFAAKIFYEYYCNPDKMEKLPRATKENLQKFKNTVQNLVEKSAVKEPKEFLIKQIVRQYGFPYLYQLGDLAEFEWFAPKSKDTDNYVIIGPDYTVLRAKWVYSKSGYRIGQFSNEMKDFPKLNQIIALLALFRKTTLETNCTEVIGQKEIHHFQTVLGKESLPMLQLFNIKKSSEKLSEVIFTPWENNTQEALTAIIVHYSLVIVALSHDKLLTPFVTILTQTAKSKEMYWPTMRDDIIDVVVDGTAGEARWKCPNGHDYFIGDCGNPVIKRGGQAKCFCGALIGGEKHHKERKGNVQVVKKHDHDSKGETKLGHFLDPPDLRTTDPIPERDLSPLSNCILRLLLHALCVWVASSNDKVACEELSQAAIQNEPVPPEQILNFFWHHLERDLQTLARATQQSFDNCVLFIHTLVHNMLTVKHDDISGIDTSLQSRQARSSWEVCFDNIFIKPMTKDINDHIHIGRQRIIEDLGKDERTMQQMVYETLPRASTDIVPHLWIYRPQVTIDHVAQSLQHNTSVAGITILQKFLSKVPLLSALQYLPDIVQLQTSLYEICHHRIDQNDARMSLERFINDYLAKVHQRQRLTKWAQSFCCAWNIVKRELLTLMDVIVPQKYVSTKMTIKQPLGFFLPMEQGEGVCSIALARYLARLQNDFIDLSWEKMKLKSISGKHEVPLSKIQHCQMISFEHQLSHVIFSHCKYSLKAGHGADVTYDYVALEKHILDRFVRGKPLIFCDIPIMSYCSDVLEAVTFTKIRKTIEQSPLPQRKRDDIIHEIFRKQCLQDCIDIVNIAMGFIQYGNWKPQTMMRRYMVSFKMDGKLPKTIEEHCQLTHIISLWRILNVEQAQQIIKRKDDPFPDINKAFKQELTKEETETLKTALGPFDMDQFLEIFYEFIVTQVKNRQEFEAEDSLIDSYIDGCDYFDLEKIPSFEDMFPNEFSLQHVTEIWKYAVKYKEDQQKKQRLCL